MEEMPSISIESFIFDPRPNYPLVITSKRYRSNRTTLSACGPNALTLVFAHGTGFHKEHWEPTIEHLWDIVEQNQPPGVEIREAWSIDCPNHGEAAFLNDDTLQRGYDERFGWEEYARCVHLLLTQQGVGLPPGTDFTQHNLVGVGHSMGAIAMVLAHSYLPNPHRTPRLTGFYTWKSLVLVEPMLVPPWGEGRTGSTLLTGAQRRRDIWPSKREAFESLVGRKSFQVWDRRVLQLFCEYGLRDLPTADYPEKTEGVTLACSKIQEAACYRDPVGQMRAYNYLSSACDALPVHAIFGSLDDAVPADVKDDIVTVAAQGKLASVQRVQGAGHLVVQVKPQGLAQAIAGAIRRLALDRTTTTSASVAMSKL